MSDTRLILGLGNPGREYSRTRHNLGFLVLDHLVEQCGLKIAASSVCKAYEARGQFGATPVILLWPQTMMNRSGRAVKPMLDKEDIDLDNVLVVCDDLNLDFGQLRIRRRGSAGGHNGLSSVIQEVQSEDFPRLRIGIGASASKDDTVDFVLANFTDAEEKEIPDIVGQSAQCCQAWVNEDIDRVMSCYNNI